MTKKSGRTQVYPNLPITRDGFCGLAPKFAGSNPAEAVGFFGRKNPQRAFLRRGSKRIFPMSQLCGMSKNLVIYVNYGFASKIPGIVSSFASRGLSLHLVCAAPLEMNEGTHSGKSTIYLKAAVL